MKLLLTNSLSTNTKSNEGGGRKGGVGGEGRVGFQNRRRYIRKFFIPFLPQNIYKTAHNLGKINGAELKLKGRAMNIK